DRSFETYDALGRLAALQDRNGNRMEFYYDLAGRLSTILDTLGRLTTLEYYPVLFNGTEYDVKSGRLKALIDPAGRRVEYKYDESGDLVKASLEDRTLGYAYSSHSDPKQAHNLTSLTDPRGLQALALKYDSQDKLTSLGRGGAALALSCGATATVTDPNGHPHAYRHDDQGRPLSVTEGSSTTTFAYNADGLVSAVTLPEGNSLTYAYQGGEARGRGNRLSISENAGPRGAEEPSRVSRFTYDPFFNLLRQASTPEGLTLNHSLDGRGNVTSTSTNIPGISLSYSYNGYGQMTSMTDPLQGATGYTYHPESSPGGGGAPASAGRRLDGATGGYLRSVDTGSLAVSYSLYDQAGNLERLSRSDGLSLSSSYDSFNQPTGHSLSCAGLSPLSGTLSYGRDSNGNILSWNETWGALSRQVTSTYDPRNNPLSSTETGLGTTLYGYDGEDQLTSVTDPLGRRLSLTYNANDLLSSASLSKESVTTTTQFAYDGNGNLTAVTDPLGRVTHFTYDGFDRVRSVKDPLNNSTVIARAEMGNLQTLRRLDSAEKLLAQSAVVSDPLGRVVSRSVRELESGRDVSYAYGYEQGGRVVTITDPLGRVSSVTKNQKGQVIKEEDAAGNTVEYLYESGSNRVSQKIETEKGPSGSSQTHTTRYEYVQGDKLSKIVENVGTPLQRVTTFLYDEKGNLIGSVDPAGHAVSHEYDPQGRRIRTTRELEKGERVTAAMAYDALSNLTSLTDSFGNRTEYAYDPLGRLSKITYPDGSTLEYGYDSAGNLLREKQRSGTLITNTYDNGNRLISRTITKAAGVEGTASESYVYDGLSRLTKGTNDVSVVERRYDSLSRLIEEVQDGKSVQYGYDALGNTTRLVYPNQRVIEREFDLLNRISRVKQGSDIVSTMEFLGRSYRLASKGYQNGDLVKYLYDQGRRLTSSETKNKNQAILQSFGWGYDTLDLKSFEKRIHNGGKGDAFSYDALKRLTNVTFDSPTPETPTATGTKSRAITLDKLDNILKITDNENAMVT
ncbi:MAG TPA: hypothetical protein PLB68_09290, partial [Candidatus Aminicenantes bacterium]|nr:hypothetical protein [Candidatus Aminicenantes bacterium]